MRKLRLTSTAIDDLSDIAEYIAENSANRATGRTFAGQLRAQCRKLASLPGTLGRPRPELHPSLRSFAFRDYAIFFRYREDIFEVVNILEGHRDIDSYFKDHKLSD
jgi:toxin ParE1/3/4